MSPVLQELVSLNHALSSDFQFLDVWLRAFLDEFFDDFLLLRLIRVRSVGFVVRQLLSFDQFLYDFLRAVLEFEFFRSSRIFIYSPELTSTLAN